MKAKRKTHDRRFAYAAKELSRRIHRDVNDAVITWDCFMTETKTGEGAGSAIVTAPGYNPKRYTIYATERGHWYTL